MLGGEWVGRAALKPQRAGVKKLKERRIVVNLLVGTGAIGRTLRVWVWVGTGLVVQ